MENKNTITIRYYENGKIEVLGKGITIDSKSFISLTNMKAKDGDFFISDWLRNRNTLEYMGIWERIHNPDSKPVEFDGFRMQAGLNSFALTPKQWIEEGHSQSERLQRLNEVAIQQMKLLTRDNSMKNLNGGENE